ncbi:DUF2165 domain-containing protein [Georgenia satyanarayanai]|uniref:DUF2165 family protein n=1 Tax=Georgenia satyanarayanai TaxID=860221 RepID=UPI00204252BF|nr:DUF2165 domain-containing protein [Georgenia satyanarayanai]MCM3660912.1 DUF2165 domain-containing protein [Georgenia satyanarayanai]
MKSALVATVGGFALLVVFGNITDYNSNFQFVKHVLAMDARRPDLGLSIEYRAINWEWAWHAAYIGVIVVETFIMVACLYGAYRMVRAARLGDVDFIAAKKWPVLGLFAGLFLWFFGFQAVGGEWFAMWMNESWNGIPDAVRLCTYIATVLIILLVGGDRLDELPREAAVDREQRMDAGDRV